MSETREPDYDLNPEQRARRRIDALLSDAGWDLQDFKKMDLSKPYVAVREYQLPGGPVDYLLYVDRKAIGTVEAKKEGETLRPVEWQASRYAQAFSDKAEKEAIPNFGFPLPVSYISTGTETLFENRTEPNHRPREVFAFHRGEFLSEVVRMGSIRSGVFELPHLAKQDLRDCQVDAIIGLEDSLRANRPRALVEMATGGGKTIAAIAHAYRLLRWAEAKRILFLVDRRNLGIQAKRDFENWVTPDDGRKLSELFPVHLLTSNTIPESASVVITTIQRLRSMLKGEEAFDGENEDFSGWELAGLASEPTPIQYRPEVPIETFDYIFIDECHRSIYGPMGQVLDYFDAFQIGLTATPSRVTYGYFSKNVLGEGETEPNVVSQYPYEESVLDGVNVGYVVYRIRTRITEGGGHLEAGEWVDLRDKNTRARDPHQLDEDFDFTEKDLNAAIVVKDQIRTIVRAFKDAMPMLFPGRTTVPKTAVFCKDESHAEDVLEIVREEFGQGSEFAKKITYKTEGSSEQAIQDFRTDPRFRIAVTVDQISTGTDIKSIECLLFLRKVKSRLLFEQMRGRGVRTIDPNDLAAVTPDAGAKDQFVLVDAVGVTDDETVWAVSPPLDREPSVPLEKLLQSLAQGSTDEALLKSISARLLRLDKRMEDPDREAITQQLDGQSLVELARTLVDATNPDEWHERAAHDHGGEPSEEQIQLARQDLALTATSPLLSAETREAILAINVKTHQVIDRQSQDEVLSADLITEDIAESTIETWEEFVRDHKDEYLALAIHYSQPQTRRLSLSDVRELAKAISLPPRSLTPERIWGAYERLDKNRVKGSGFKNLVDLVSLVRFTAEQNDDLTPHADAVRLRYSLWLTEQESDGRTFTAEQRRWLDMFCHQIATSLEVRKDDFDDPPFAQEGGIFHASEIFGSDLDDLIEELNRELAIV
ncbi:MAG: DEAD/DEAH box helicase family protein [Solirubrobacterales bacterium]|nr:DEAD/DEAH box helicase family protein [Solirubrobacterales bacterium]